MESGLVLRWIALVSVAFFVQLGFLVDLRIFGVHPELMLLVTVCAGLAGGSDRGAGVGFVSGLCVDFLINGTLGVTALCFTLVGFGVGVIGDLIIRSTRVLSIAIAVVASAVGVLVYASVSELLGAHSLSDPNLWRIVGIVALLNGLLCIPVLSLCRRAEGVHLGPNVY